ncbi:MAG: isoleucine--tRNA ligase [Alphaproteobacteria bacterium CG_4_10_14_0_8_um_filter_53_9]|nr:MAG: isoleucine--tRNA ligase [Alphaproteobacteria bacterium CG_4_10_14_0_8_um_filter_53_9]
MTSDTAPKAAKAAPKFPMNLPVTGFPMRAGLAVNEPKWVEKWLADDLYGQMRAARAGADKYIVHLGPPYANGHFHMGHVLTYVLKDLVVRSKFAAGFDSPYAPGWDCHGLPIEWKIEQELRAGGQTKNDISRTELRAKCRAYAQSWIDVQKGEWQRFGALGDWDNVYRTMAPANEAGIVGALGELVQKGFVYKALRSTLWSWAEETALAEAEVEYADKTSTAIYVALPIVGRENEHLVIWTTTPWTLPANRAVAIDETKNYVNCKINGKICWVAFDLYDVLAHMFDDFAAMGEVVQGKVMLGWEYEHPLYAGVTGKVYHGDHVTVDGGTGLVHTAPAHGADDYWLGVREKLDLRCPVDGAGCYEDWVEDDLAEDSPLRGKLAGKLIWKCEADLLDALGPKLLKAEKMTHSYPVSWRSKEKLIFRTTEQWFVALDKKMECLEGKTLREASLDRIYGRDGVRGVNWVPGYGANRIGSMIEKRPDWCISRQRAWGVPVALMLHKETGEIVADKAVWDHVVALMMREGIDAWDGRLESGRAAELFPDGWLAANGASVDDYEFITDILDVWFDSGTTWKHVLEADSTDGKRFDRHGDGKRVADLYQEGSDQHRGWFHSSLLTSVALRGDAPYESVVTSGFVVDGQGRKFSKSLGNGVEPRTLLDTYGMDIIRLWVASSDYSEDIRYSDEVMKGTSEAYRKYRNVFRWLLGNLNGYAADKAVAYDAMPELEQYVLHKLAEVCGEVQADYEAFAFHKGTRKLYMFVETVLSNLYFEARKDVLYCNRMDDAERLAVQTVLDHVLRALLTHLAPILCFTTEEAWHRYATEILGEDEAAVQSVHLQTFAPVASEWRRDDTFAVRWDALLALRGEVNVALEAMRTEGNLGSNAEAVVRAPVGASDTALARVLLGVSKVEAGENLSVAKHEGEKCPRCWLYYDSLGAQGVCLRCEEAI